MQRLRLVLVVLALVVGAAAACDDSSADTTTTSTQSGTTTGGSDAPDLPAYDPLSIITLRSDSFRSGEEYAITFAGGDGYEAFLVVPCEEAGEVDVAVPLYISPISRAFGSSPMTAHFNSEDFAFLANDLPELSSTPGEGLAASLGRSLAATQSALNHLEAMAAVDDNDVDLEHIISMITQQITGQQDVLDDLTDNGRLILTDGKSQITLSGDQLTQVDRILYSLYSSLLQGRVDSVDLQMADQAGSSNPLNPDRDRVAEGVYASLMANGPGRVDTIDLQIPDQAGSSNPLNPDWDRVAQEVHAYLMANGPDRLRLVGDAMWTGHTGWSPLDMQMDEQGYAAAFAAAHSGVAMASAAMAELTFGSGASDPENCQKLANGISSMETAIKLIDITSKSAGAYPQHWFYDNGAAYRGWKEDNQAMLGTMRSWASPYCPDLSGPGTPVDGDATTTQPAVVPFPWTFSGPVTSDNTIGAPNPLEFSYIYEATITLFEDGTLEYSILLPAGRQGLTVDCTNGTSYLSTDYPEDGGSWQGEHEDGEFKVRFTDTMVREGTYTHEELHYEVRFESDFAVCDGTVGVTSMRVEEAYLPRTAP